MAEETGFAFSMDSFRLDGKVALVTGGSYGIGFAIATALAQAGAKIAFNDRDQQKLEAGLASYAEAGVDARGYLADVTDEAQVAELVANIERDLGGVDILVNNAGVSESTPFGAYTGELFDRVMDLNVKGMFHCARGAVPWMERQGRGVILNTSSMVSFYGQPAGVAYPVSKFAVNGFTLSLARELAPKGIRVNAVAPGIIETDMLRAVPREVLAPLEAQIPLGRVGQPGEVAEAFVFLASEQASYITGVVLRVDGLARA